MHRNGKKREQGRGPRVRPPWASPWVLCPLAALLVLWKLHARSVELPVEPELARHSSGPGAGGPSAARPASAAGWMWGNRHASSVAHPAEVLAEKGQPVFGSFRAGEHDPFGPPGESETEAQGGAAGDAASAAQGSGRPASSGQGGGGGGGGDGATAAGGTIRQERRVSGLAPRPSEAVLQGGWEFNEAVYDRLLRHPNVSVPSHSAPRVLHFRQLLSREETEHLIALATGSLARSEVVTDGDVVADIRTSSGSWLSGKKRDAKVLAIQHRIHSIVGIPEEFGESLHVLRYEHAQSYSLHDDHCWGHRERPLEDACRAFLMRAGGPGCGRGAGGPTCGDRLLTVVMYLRSPNRGGATAFPHAKIVAGPSATHGHLHRRQLLSSRRWGDAGSTAIVDGVEVPWYCREGAGVLQVSPEPGDAAIFWDYMPGAGGALAVPDETAVHAGCPIIEGTKFIATRWIRSAEFT